MLLAILDLVHFQVPSISILCTGVPRRGFLVELAPSKFLWDFEFMTGGGHFYGVMNFLVSYLFF